jgi:hypothetical protein
LQAASSSEDYNASAGQKGNRDKAGWGRLIGVVLFTIGVILGMFLIGVSVYADFEATLFEVSIISDQVIRPIQCPIFISRNETGLVTTTLKNSGGNTREYRIQAHISKGHLILIRKLENILYLDPDQSQKITWEIYPQDAAFNHLILVKVLIVNAGTNTTHKGSCGVVVLNLPGEINGRQLFWVSFISALVFLVSGASFWWKFGRSYTGRRLEATRSILGLGVLVLVGLISTATGIWELAAGSFYVGMLMIGVIVPHFMINR